MYFEEFIAGELEKLGRKFRLDFSCFPRTSIMARQINAKLEQFSIDGNIEVVVKSPGLTSTSSTSNFFGV